MGTTPEAITLSGLIALDHTTEIKQTNLSGALIKGFRPSNPLFKQTLMGSSKAPKSAFVGMNGIHRSLLEGKKTTTKFPLDAALTGPGYFSVISADGKVRYKRTIEGNIDPLTFEYKTAEGDSIQGTGGNIVFPNGTMPSDVNINKEGDIMVGGKTLGSFSIVRFKNEDALKMGPRNTVESADDNPELLPITDETGRVLTFVNQGVVEESGTQAPSTMIDLMAAFRQFQAVNDFAKAEHKRQLDMIRKFTKALSI